MNAVVAVAVGALGALAGALSPRLVAVIPDRPPHADDPPPTPYRELAATPNLPRLLGTVVAALWALLALSDIEPTAALPAYLVVTALGVAMAYVDLREYRLPDWLTLPAFGSAAILLAVAAVATGEWEAYGRAWAAAGVCLVFYFMLALIRPADLGLGDVKLAAVLGLLLGWVGWSAVVLGVFVGFLAGGLAGIALLLTGRASRRSSIPFGPPMLAGALLVIVLS